MNRPEITAERADEVRRLMHAGAAVEAAAQQAGVTPYVARLIWENRDVPGLGPRRGNKTSRRLQNPHLGLEATTIRQIRRMLDGGWLEPVQIAREVGVSVSVVSDVALGRREAINTTRPILDRGEEFLKRPVRCDGCGALISIVPCRACRTQRYAEFVSTLRVVLKKHCPKLDLTSPAISAPMRALSNSIQRGGQVMEKLLPLATSEINGFFVARDRREHVIRRAETLFDQAIEPNDLPGADQRDVDPMLRASIRPLVGRIYDELTAKLDESAEPPRN